RIADAAKTNPSIVQAEEADHIVLIDPVTGHAKAANQLIAAIYRHAAGKNLDPVFQPVLPRRDIRRIRAAHRCIGRRRPGNKGQMLPQIGEDQRSLQPCGKDIEISNRARQRSIGTAKFAIREIGAGQVATGAVRKSGLAGKRIGVVQKCSHASDKSGNICIRIAQQLGCRLTARKKGCCPRLLQRNIGSEYRSIGGADDSEYLAMRIDYRNRNLRSAVERLADLRPCAGHDDERFFQYRPRFGGGQRRGYVTCICGVAEGAADSGADTVDFLYIVGGIVGKMEPMLEPGDWDTFDDAIEVMLKGPLRVLRAFLARLGQGSKVIVFSSQLAASTWPYGGFYP